MTSGSGSPTRRWYRVEEAARLLEISLATAYRRVADGTIPAQTIGGVIRIPVVEFRRKFNLDRQVAT